MLLQHLGRFLVCTCVPFGQLRELWSWGVNGMDVITGDKGRSSGGLWSKQELKQRVLTATVPKRLHHLHTDDVKWLCSTSVCQCWLSLTLYDGCALLTPGYKHYNLQPNWNGTHGPTSLIKVVESVLRFSNMWPAWLCLSLASSSRGCGAAWSLLVTLAFGLGTLWKDKQNKQ